MGPVYRVIPFTRSGSSEFEDGGEGDADDNDGMDYDWKQVLQPAPVGGDVHLFLNS